MSWLGLTHKGVEPLFPEEWNAVVDGLDILKQYTDQSVKFDDLKALPSDIVPAKTDTYSLGKPGVFWLSLYARNIVTGDVHFTDIKCALCGEEFREGEAIIFIVLERGSESIRTVPVHLRCALRHGYRDF